MRGCQAGALRRLLSDLEGAKKPVGRRLVGRLSSGNETLRVRSAPGSDEYVDPVGHEYPVLLYRIAIIGQGRTEGCIMGGNIYLCCRWCRPISVSGTAKAKYIYR